LLIWKTRADWSSPIWSVSWNGFCCMHDRCHYTKLHQFPFV